MPGVLKAFIWIQNPSLSVAVMQAYVAMAARLKEGDPRVADEAAALRIEISKANRSRFLALAPAFAAIAETDHQVIIPDRDLAILLDRMSLLRTSDECQVLAAAIKQVTRSGMRPMSWDKVGLVVTAALLQPVCTGEPATQLLNDYEETLRQRPDAPKLLKSWSGDVWEFAGWARDNLPGFDPDQPNVGFLAH